MIFRGYVIYIWYLKDMWYNVYRWYLEDMCYIDDI